MNSIESAKPLAVASSFQPFKAVAKVARQISQSLSAIFRRMDQQPASLGPQYGQRFDSKAPEGTTLNGYRILGDKAKGVEPGFTALKDWDPQDDIDLKTAGHALNTAGRQWLEDRLHGNLKDERLLETLQTSIRTLAADGDLSATHAKLLQGMSDFPSDNAMQAFRNCPDEDSELVDKIVQMSLEKIVDARNTPEMAPLHQGLKDHLMQTQLKFTEKHYIKLDYYEKNKICGRYTLPFAKTKALAGIPILGNLLHKLGKLTTPREINRGAVNEKLANDLMQKLGMQTQTLDLVHGSYEDGTPKLLLDSTHIEGFNDFDGEKNATKGSVYIKDGVLVKNTPLPDDPPGEFNGPPKLHTGIKDLGDKKVMMLLLADRDALGSKGGNKGFVGDQFFAIDPGHALEGKLLSKRGDVHSDLSFDPASSLASKDYKNFSIFDQSTFAEKMAGVRKLQQLEGEDSALFDEYAKEYGPPSNEHEALNFQEQLRKTKEQYIGRKEDILNTFASRLAVDNYSFGGSIDSNPELKRNYRDQTLNLLDGLEKLTSTTVGTAQGKENGVRLEIPQILKPEHRKAWDVRQNGEHIEFTFDGKAAEAQKILKTLEDYGNKLVNPPAPYTIQNSKGQITLSVPREQILQAQSALSYSQIMHYKHPTGDHP